MTLVFDNGDVQVRMYPEAKEPVLITGPMGEGIYLMAKELADIADAVEQRLSAAEEPLFTEEDIEAGHQAIVEYCETVLNRERAPF